MKDSTDLKTPGYMLYCVVISCIGSFSNGWVIGSVNIPGEATHACENGDGYIFNNAFPDCLPMSTTLWGFAVSVFCLGGLVGSFFGGKIQTKYGRKKTIIFNNLGWIIGGILQGVAINPIMFIVGRIFCGLSCGLGSLATPTYVGEISTIKARGTMGACNQFAIVIGILLASVIGLPLAKVPLWRINYALVSIPAIAQFFLMFTCLETPRYLISINHIEEARESLQRLRPESSIENEFYNMIEGQLGITAAKAIFGSTNDHLHENENNDNDKDKDNSFDKGDQTDDGTVAHHSDINREPINMIQVFTDPLIRRIATIVITLHVIQQLIGMNAVMYYSTTIFNMSFSSATSQYMAILTTGVNFISTLFSLILIDRMGRRPLLLIAEMGAGLCSILLIIGYLYNSGPLLVFSVFGYVTSFAIGIGPIPWMITSEITPIYASSAVGAIATAVNWAMSFTIGQCFPLVFEAIKGYSFAIFAGIAILAFIFTYFKVPETKACSLEKIVNSFERN